MRKRSDIAQKCPPPNLPPTGGGKGSFKIAQITAAHGIRGEVKLACFLENPDDIARYNPLTNKAGKAFHLKITGHVKEQLMVKIDGVDDRNAAEMLRGVELYADGSKLPAKSGNEYYVRELIGLQAAADGKIIGNVTAIHNFGAGDIIEIQTEEGELLLPFKAPFVGKIEGGKIEIMLPEYVGEEK